MWRTIALPAGMTEWICYFDVANMPHTLQSHCSSNHRDGSRWQIWLIMGYEADPPRLLFSRDEVICVTLTDRNSSCDR